MLYKDYLYMPEYGVMSHVYDSKYETPTYVPWGRGNGWVLFSFLKSSNPCRRNTRDYDKLLGFYKELCEGCLKLQVKTDYGTRRIRSGIL